MSDYGTTWEDIEPTPQLEKNPTRNALDRFTTDPTDTQEKEYVERVAVFMSEDMLKTIIEDYYCLLYTSPSPRDLSTSRMPSSA